LSTLNNTHSPFHFQDNKATPSPEGVFKTYSYDIISQNTFKLGVKMTKRDKIYLRFFASATLLASLILGFVFVNYFESLMFGIGFILFGIVTSGVLVAFDLASKTITEEEALQNALNWYTERGYCLITDADIKIIEVSRKVPTYYYPLLGAATINGEKSVTDYLFKITSPTINWEFLLSDAEIKSGEAYPQKNDEVRTDSTTRILVKFYEGKKFAFTY